jgi:hypothetical protein
LGPRVNHWDAQSPPPKLGLGEPGGPSGLEWWAEAGANPDLTRRLLPQKVPPAFRILVSTVGIVSQICDLTPPSPRSVLPTHQFSVTGPRASGADIEWIQIVGSPSPWERREGSGQRLTLWTAGPCDSGAGGPKPRPTALRTFLAATTCSARARVLGGFPDISGLRSVCRSHLQPPAATG